MLALALSEDLKFSADGVMFDARTLEKKDWMCPGAGQVSGDNGNSTANLTINTNSSWCGDGGGLANSKAPSANATKVRAPVDQEAKKLANSTITGEIS